MTTSRLPLPMHTGFSIRWSRLPMRARAAEVRHCIRSARPVVCCLTSIADVPLRIGKNLGEMSADVPHALRRRLPVLARRLGFRLGMVPALHFLSNRVGPVAAPFVGDSFSLARQALRRSWATLAANASIDSMGVRHAMRLGVATMLTFLIVRILHIPFGYWAAMATLLIRQPSIAMTWPRGLERAVGSTAGAALAIVIGFLAHTPLAITLVVFPLVCLTMALRRVSYSLYVIFLTPTFVLVADFCDRCQRVRLCHGTAWQQCPGLRDRITCSVLSLAPRKAGSPPGTNRRRGHKMAENGESPPRASRAR